MKARSVFAAVLAAILLIASCIYIFTVARSPEEDGLTEVSLYYINDMTGVIETEKRRLRIPESREEAVLTVYNEYMNGPVNTNLSLADPELKNFTALTYPMDGNESVAKINFTDSFYGLSESRRLLCIAGAVYTLTELDFLRNVYFYVNNEPLLNINGDAAERYNRNNVAINPSLDPEKTNRRQVVLYFTNAQQRWLMPEERSIEIKQSQTTEYQIVEQLIQGPLDSSLVPTVSSEVKIRDIKTEEGICYVNLSSEFVTKHNGGSAGEVMTIYSIVNSLTELDTVKKVQFLVEGEKLTEYKGHLDFSKTFERDTSLIYEDKEHSE